MPPAVTADTLALPRVAAPAPAETERPVTMNASAPTGTQSQPTAGDHTVMPGKPWAAIRLPEIDAHTGDLESPSLRSQLQRSQRANGTHDRSSEVTNNQRGRLTVIHLMNAAEIAATVTSMVSRVGVDPISDPGTASMEMLLAALGRPQLYRAGSPNVLCSLRFRLHLIARARLEQVAWTATKGSSPQSGNRHTGPWQQPRRPVAQSG
jgi:hypothetical protein